MKFSRLTTDSLRTRACWLSTGWETKQSMAGDTGLRRTATPSPQNPRPHAVFSLTLATLHRAGDAERCHIEGDISRYLGCSGNVLGALSYCYHSQTRTSQLGWRLSPPTPHRQERAGGRAFNHGSDRCGEGALYGSLGCPLGTGQTGPEKWMPCCHTGHRYSIQKQMEGIRGFDGSREETGCVVAFQDLAVKSQFRT